MFRIDRRILSHFDYLIVFSTLPIVLISFHLIYEVDSALSIKQSIYVAITLILSFLIFILPIKKLFWITPFYYWLSILLLIATEFIGTEKFGAQRWIELPFLSMSIQPSEIAKSALMLMLAYNIANDPPPKEGYHFLAFFKHAFFILLPAILVKIQPDLGTAMLILIIGFGILFLVGIHKKVILTICALGIFLMPFIYIFALKGYQMDRIEQFLGPTPQHQVQQSMIAIGSGGFLGKDLESSTQAQLRFLPVPESDFIFAYFMERYGFVGGMLLLFLYGLLILHLFSISYNMRADKILQVLSAAIGLLIFVHLSVNILMVIKFAPVVGIPLPFFSYGGTSFLSFGLLFAVLQNLLANRFNLKP